MSKEMTAVEFLKAISRMCTWKTRCAECKLDPLDFCINGLKLDNIEKIVETVQKWVEEHPVNTRQSEFLKLYPNAGINDGAIKLCPLDLNVNFNCKATSERISCNTCRKDYWLQEVK